MFDQVDADGNGRIDFDEFVAAAIDHAKLLTEDHIRIMFDYFDKDGKGTITKEDMMKALPPQKALIEEELTRQRDFEVYANTR